MNRLFLLVLTLVILIISCKEENEKIKYPFKGKIVDYYTGGGVENAVVYLKDMSIDPSNPQLTVLDLYDTTAIIDRVYSNKNGDFNKIVNLDKGNYGVIVYDSKYISLDTLFVNSGSIRDISLKVKRFKSLIISFKNVSKTADSLTLIIDSYDIISKQFHIAAVDTLIVYKEAIPETRCGIHYGLWQDGVLKLTKDTMKIISRFDDDNLDIKY